ncbi:tyrosine-type recombinase/integrase [Bacillus cereus]|uniref:tyrosine-type recombinase/integrase n=1 Tax=Bacillus cereus group TaxID=86661 RepID=UPI000BECD70B|nr:MULTISPECIES: tyrosine-type recombinase/integrase [Bacillus cereus group]MCH5476765.1 tyrosine-type recombinase/integrase [Bacillus cereus]PEF03400.1 site-specific integrase [Bacillus thuringiensis]
MNEVQPIRKKTEINKMKRALHGRNRLLFVLGINLGLRISDLLELKVSDLKDENNKFRKYLVVTEKKTQKVRKVTISTTVRKEIKDAGISEFSEDYIFPSRRGSKPIGRVQAYRILNEAADRAGLSEIGTHTLRKTFGFHAYKGGASIQTLQKIFNHSSEKVTLHYIGITQDTIDDVYESLSL